MAAPVGRTSYKKKDGILTLTTNHQTVTWTPNSGGPPAVSLPLAHIINLQQTPDTAAKVMLKIIEKAPDSADQVNYLFHFNTTEAKAEATAVKELLSRLLANVRANDSSVPRPSAGTPSASTPQQTGDAPGSASGSMAFASAVNSQPALAKWFDDNALKNDIELQQSLMKKDSSLHQTYMEAIATKPDTISGAAFNSQFWSTRTNLLRAHAIESSQRKGAYNVLSTVKPRTVDGELKLNISVEQVQMIFAQHPLVKRIYNENVPKLSEAQFWSRFFLSRLSKKLRGERITENDPPDGLFDKYDPSENTVGFQSRIMAQSVPHIINLEGNEENQGGFKSGNAKDVEMRPRANIPIVKTLNSLSERIMANVAPSDAYEEGGPGYDTYSELALRDLQGPAKEFRIMLNVKEQTKFFSKHDSAPSSNAQTFQKQNPAQVLKLVNSTISSLAPEQTNSNKNGVDIQSFLGFDPDSDSEDDEPTSKKPHVNSRAAIQAAESDIMNGLRQHRSQAFSPYDQPPPPASSSAGPTAALAAAAAPTQIMGLSSTLTEKATITHATTMEFLHQFWSAFLSGDADRALELQYLAESLRRSSERIAAVAEEAEAERADVIKKRRAEIKDHYEKTGKKIRWRSDMVGGGKEAVEGVMGGVKDALEKAVGEYGRAWKEEGVQISTEGTA